MRLAWREAMPAFTRFYGLMPWDLERLTFGELDAYLRHWQKHQDAQREAAVKAKRRKVG